MSSPACRRPAFLLQQRPAGSAAVLDFNAAKAAAVAATPHDGPVRFDDDESGIALTDSPLHDDTESVVSASAQSTIETPAAGETVPNDDSETPTVAVATPDVSDEAANDSIVSRKGAFQGKGVEPMESGRRTEEARMKAIKALRQEVKTLTAAAKAAATKAAAAENAVIKAVDKVTEREAVAASLTGTAQIREQAKIATARTAVERAKAEAKRLNEDAEEAERKRGEAEGELVTLESKDDEDDDATPEVKYLNHCIADWTYRPGGASAENAENVDEVFYHYDGIYWVPQTDKKDAHRAASFARKNTPQKATSHLVHSMIDILRMIMLEEYAKPATPKGKIYIQLLNAVLEVRKEANGKVLVYAHKPAPHFGTTSCVQARIDWKRSVGPLDSKGSGIYTPAPLRKTSLFGGYIYTSCQDEDDMVYYVAEAMGSTVTGDKTWRKAILLVGPKRSGKSTFQMLLTRVFHPKWAAVNPEKWADDFGMENMIGKTLYVAAETEYFPAKEFKAVVASDMVDVTRKNKLAISMIPRGRLIIACNDPPRYRDDPSGAIADRLCCIPWDVQAETKPGGVNTDLVEQIVGNPDELLQMVDFVIDGAVRLVQRGDFMPDAEAPTRVRALKARVIGDNNPVSPFVDAHNVKAAANGEYIPKFEVYPLYVKHCDMTGVKPQFRLNEIHFWRQMYAFFGKTWPRHQRNGIDYVPLTMRDVKSV